MLNWEDSPNEIEVFKDWMPWFGAALASKSFRPLANEPNSLTELPRHVLEAIEDSKVYYNKLHALRLRPNISTDLIVSI